MFREVPGYSRFSRFVATLHKLISSAAVISSTQVMLLLLLTDIVAFFRRNINNNNDVINYEKILPQRLCLEIFSRPCQTSTDELVKQTEHNNLCLLASVTSEKNTLLVEEICRDALIESLYIL